MLEITSRLRLFINLLLILEMLLGVTIIAVTCFYESTLSSFLSETESKMLTASFFNVYILGFQVLASFLCGVSMWASILPRRFSVDVQLLLSTWLFFCFLVVTCGCANIWILFSNSDTVAEGAEILLLKGIDNYYLNPEWKLLWDKLQYTKECCGVHGYQDWLQANWMRENFKDYKDVQEELEFETITPACPAENADTEELLRQTRDSPQILAPYACCKRNSTLCYANYMPHLKREDAPSVSLPHLNLLDINTAGCFPLFVRQLKFSVRVVFILILVAVFIDILICSLTKYVMATNYKRCPQDYNHDSCLMDDEGNALVVIKCPPKVRCITLQEANTFPAFDIPQVASPMDMCPCCNDNHENVIELEHSVPRDKEKHSALVH